MDRQTTSKAVYYVPAVLTLIHVAKAVKGRPLHTASTQLRGLSASVLYRTTVNRSYEENTWKAIDGGNPASS